MRCSLMMVKSSRPWSSRGRTKALSGFSLLVVFNMFFYLHEYKDDEHDNEDRRYDDGDHSGVRLSLCLRFCVAGHGGVLLDMVIISCSIKYRSTL